MPGLLSAASLEWAGGAAFGEDGASWSQTNSLILIARSARRSYRGKAGSTVARSTITGLATVWSAPRQVMTQQPAAVMLRYQPAASPKVSGITNPPAAAGRMPSGVA